MRQRQISGTLSDHSHSSNREVVYIKSDVGDAKLVEERMVFISHGKVPFSVSSTIPYNKYNKVSRYFIKFFETLKLGFVLWFEL